MDMLDPAQTALMMVHMAKGVAGDVDTPFNRMFRHRAEGTVIIKHARWAGVEPHHAAQRQAEVFGRRPACQGELSPLVQSKSA